MRPSHRDRRVSRDIARSAWGMLALVLALGVLALFAPMEAFRFAAVVGLAMAGGIYLWESNQTIGEYVRDLDEVRRGGTVSGRLRAEVGSAAAVEDGPRRRARSVPPPRRTAEPPAPPVASGPGD